MTVPITDPAAPVVETPQTPAAPAVQPFSLPSNLGSVEELPAELQPLADRLYSPRGVDGVLQLNWKEAPDVAQERDAKALRILELEQLLAQPAAKPAEEAPASPAPDPTPEAKGGLTEQLQLMRDQHALEKKGWENEAGELAEFRAAEESRKTASLVGDGLAALGVTDPRHQAFLVSQAKGTGGEFVVLAGKAAYRPPGGGDLQPLATVYATMVADPIIAQALAPSPAKLSGPPGGAKTPAPAPAGVVKFGPKTTAQASGGNVRVI